MSSKRIYLEQYAQQDPGCPAAAFGGDDPLRAMVRAQISSGYGRVMVSGVAAVPLPLALLATTSTV